ncbi:MAG: class IV adenylate cyclase [Fluviicola sp.]|nr:class IV adenylate cyclase [Fluviicola sp.]
MHIKNVEFKARIADWKTLETKLVTLNPVFQGTDHQVDTYFNVPKGRLKLREGSIEHALIQYERGNTADAKASDIVLYQHEPNPALKQILTHQFGIKVVIDKQRKIYFIDHVKFHFDVVEGLGNFIEVEAIDAKNAFTLEELKSKCDHYFSFFELQKEHLEALSYSDLLLSKLK